MCQALWGRGYVVLLASRRRHPHRAGDEPVAIPSGYCRRTRAHETPDAVPGPGAPRASWLSIPCREKVRQRRRPAPSAGCQNGHISTPPTGDDGVLGSLPRTRPGRSTARREAARAKRGAAAADGAKAAPKPRAAKPAAPAAKAAAKPAAKPAAPRAVAAVPDAPATPEAVTPAAKPAPTATPAKRTRVPAPVAKAAHSESRGAAMRAPRKAAVKVKPKQTAAKPAAAEQVPPAGWAVPGDGHGTADPAGALLKLADAGAGLLKGLLSRLPG